MGKKSRPKGLRLPTFYPRAQAGEPAFVLAASSIKLGSLGHPECIKCQALASRVKIADLKEFCKLLLIIGCSKSKARCWRLVRRIHR